MKCDRAYILKKENAVMKSSPAQIIAVQRFLPQYSLNPFAPAQSNPIEKDGNSNTHEPNV